MHFWRVCAVAVVSMVPAESARANDWKNCWNNYANNPTKAIQDCTRAINDRRFDRVRLAQLYGVRAAAYRNTNQCTVSIADASQAIRLQPNVPNALVTRSDCYRMLGQYDQAIADTSQAIRIDPRFSIAFSARGQARQLAGSIEMARADYRAALSIPAVDHNGVIAHEVSQAQLAALDAAEEQARRTRLEEEERERQARLREARESELRAAEARRVEREAREAREREERRMRELRAQREKEQQAAFASDRADCQRYVVSACDRALQSQVATEAERSDLNRWRAAALAAAEPKGATPTAIPDQGRRVALVIGNSNYLHAPNLARPKRDALDVAAALRRVGFAEVVEKYNATLREFAAELRKFEALAVGADWAVVYFAGHGMEIDGVNYLIPVDAKLERVNDAEDEALVLERVLLRINAARRLKLVILDACRNNPFVNRMLGFGKPTRSIGRGLARLELQPGVMVAFAARDGQLALDGTDGPNSPYATAILAHIDEPDLEIGRFFRKVRDTVLQSTGGVQQPFEYGSLPAKDFYFRTGAR